MTDEEIRELARAFYRQIEVLSLLERAGLERHQQPSWSGQSAQEYWQGINRLVESGQLPDGRLKILTAAGRDFKANRTFLKGIEQAAAAAPAGVLLAVDSVVLMADGTLVPVDWRLGLAGIVDDAARRCGLAVGTIVHRQRDTSLTGAVRDRAAAPMLVGAFAAELAGALAVHNGERVGAERVRLRLALHATADAPPAAPGAGAGADNPSPALDGPAAALTHRLVDAPGLSQLLRSDPAADLGVILSSALYDATVRHSVHGLDPTVFREIKIDLPRGVPVLPAVRSAWVTVPRPATGSASDAAARPGQAANGLAPYHPRPAAVPGDHRWDYLISVADEDGGWGAWIAWELEQRGFLVHLQAWDVLPGNNPVIQMDQAVRHAEKTLLVLSENYLRAPEVQVQWTIAWRGDPTGIQRRLVPVRVAACRPEGILHGISYIDLVDLDDSDAREAFHRGIDAVLRGRNRPTSPPPFPGPRAQS
ncbi:toll/interleukin-1 receptor domain-containing protein [Frankia sp. R82]|uniref:toll/interleukin-1 receptor domain-containing protein n=1 Tax=Frankia sp. R82 TaxID=2950553 RepID=UPI0020441384|nr:toll/interleukin-1 receptor domain-containing protein [Frankia sp. R82]MCM3884018.1 toll/interleukin-1 receptor domain-containing protein [Frankia sp. R82]